MLLEWMRRDAALVRVRVATELLVHSWVLQMVVDRCGGHLINKKTCPVSVSRFDISATILFSNTFSYLYLREQPLFSSMLPLFVVNSW